MKKYMIMLLVAIVAMTAVQAQAQTSDNSAAPIPAAEVFPTKKCAYYRSTTWTENGERFVQYEIAPCQRWEWLIAGTAGFEPKTSEMTYGATVGGEYRFCLKNKLGFTTGFEAEANHLPEWDYVVDGKLMEYHKSEWSPAIFATAGIHSGHHLSSQPGKGVELGLKVGLGMGMHNTWFPQASGEDQVYHSLDFTMAYKANVYMKFNPNKKVSPYVTIGVSGDAFNKYSSHIRVNISVGISINTSGKKSRIMKY